ncbi:MAG: nitrous oxide reductase accessory protein NosL [Rhodocyclaceae bacterium]|nr:nitrous oxide reductase accessory protein NosL [Rhodocyclaceae bacterium]
MQRRDVLAAGFLLTPLAAALSACARQGDWPEGMQPIMWDRDTCVVCGMAISDRRFAGELRGGPKQTVFKFDDPGCIVLALHDKVQQFPWLRDPATRIWVADVTSPPEAVRWLDARSAHYVAKFSPMGYNFGAIAHPQPGAIDFAAMSEHVLAKVRRKPPA